MGKKQSFFYQQIKGVPLKMELRSAEGIMTFLATGIERESLSAADSKIPAEYKETEFSEVGL